MRYNHREPTLLFQTANGNQIRVACEQALRVGRAQRDSRERASEVAVSPLSRAFSRDSLRLPR